MTIKLLLLSILAACSVNSNSGNADPLVEQPNKEAPDETEDDQHFCCKSVEPKTRSGDGCVMAAKEHVAVCTGAILYCSGSWTLSDGTATCIN